MGVKGDLLLGITSQSVMINYHQVMVKIEVRKHKCY